MRFCVAIPCFFKGVDFCDALRQVAALGCPPDEMPKEIRASSLGSTAGLYGCVVAARKSMAEMEKVSE